MFRIIYRQRRRILLTAGMATMSILVGLTTFNPLASGTPASDLLITFGIFFAVIASGVSLMILLVPQIRNVWEMLAVYTFLETSFMAMSPETNAMLSNTGFRSLVSLLAWGGLYMAFYGPMLDRLPAWFSLWSRQRITVNATPQAIWNAIVPTAGAGETYWGSQNGATTTDGPKGSSELRLAPAWRLFQNQTVNFVERSHPRHSRFYFVGEAKSASAETSEGIYEVRIQPDGDGRCQVDIYLFRSATRIREAMTLWFDDAVGDQADILRRLLSKVENPKKRRAEQDSWDSETEAA